MKTKLSILALAMVACSLTANLSYAQQQRPIIRILDRIADNARGYAESENQRRQQQAQAELELRRMQHEANLKMQQQIHQQQMRKWELQRERS